jgi:hypothetical protein
MFELVNGRDLTGAASSRPRVTKLRTDGPIGDERYFVAVRKVGSEHLWQWSIDADPGDELIVRAYVNNSCADNYGHGCWLQGTTLTLESFHKPGRTSFAANLDAVNAKRVWDGVEIKTQVLRDNTRTIINRVVDAFDELQYLIAIEHGAGELDMHGAALTAGYQDAYPTLAEAVKLTAGQWKKAHAPEMALRFLQRFHAWRTG